jgi:molybdate transport system regulatory protein
LDNTPKTKPARQKTFSLPGVFTFFRKQKNRNVMKLSARNQIKGTITNIVIGSVMAKVQVDIGNGNILNSMITIDSVKELDLKAGDTVYAVIKSTEVMIGKE